MNNDDQRDYAEEAANRALMHEEDTDAKAHDLAQYRRFVQKAADFYTMVASHPDAAICASGAGTYEGAKDCLMSAIVLAYPDINELDIYDILVDSGESVAYCAQYVRQNGQISLKR